MIESLNFNELKHICTWMLALYGKNATLGDLQKYMTENHIQRKYELLDRLFEDYSKLPE